MSSTVKLEIITLTRPLYNGRIVSVTVPTTEGEITVLPNHIALMTPLKAGEIVVRHEGGKEDYVAISGGFLVVAPKKITILVDSAEMLEELDEKKIQEAKDRAEKLLTDRQFADDRAFADATAMLEKSIAQMKVLKRKKTH
jgi:F-type H+-transporting ATPase subunit epsilon